MTESPEGLCGILLSDGSNCILERSHGGEDHENGNHVLLEAMKTSQDRRSEAGKRADSANAHAIRQLGVDLMNAFNRGKTDPSEMAVLGHDTMTGYEFCVERNGVVYVVSVGRDWAT